MLMCSDDLITIMCAPQSYADAGIQVAINIGVQHISPWGFKHPLSRAVHNCLVTYLLSEAHSGYDLPFMSHRLFPGPAPATRRIQCHGRRREQRV